MRYNAVRVITLDVIVINQITQHISAGVFSASICKK